MKNKKELSVNDIVWIVSKMTYVLGSSLTTSQGNTYSWWIDNSSDDCEVELDVDKREIRIIENSLDLKTNYALEGIASIIGFTLDDYFIR